MKQIGNIYRYNEKNITINSFLGKEQNIAVCRYVEPEYSDFMGCDRYKEHGKTFELSETDLQSAKRINSACDNCIFYRTSMHNNDVNYSRAWCAYRKTVSQDIRFSVDCTKHKVETDIKKSSISEKNAKQALDKHFKDCCLVCGSCIESKNKSVRIETVSEFRWFMADRLLSEKKFDSILKNAAGNVIVIENFPMLLSKKQCIDYSPCSSLVECHEMDLKALDYDTYVYFCSRVSDAAFLFKDLGEGIFTLHELTYQIIV